MAQDKVDVPAGLWSRCESCGHMLYEKEVAEALYVCPECGHHRRIDARTRIEQLVDPGSFEEFAVDLRSTDPLKFKDRMPYRDRLKREVSKTGEPDAVVVGRAFIRGRAVILGVMNPAFIMASMGAVVGEKVFSHESGLHADGVLKDPGNYEGYDPAEVGLRRHLVIGKHSGSHGLQNRMKGLGVDLKPFEAGALMTSVRNVAQGNKRPLSDKDLLQIYHSGGIVA